MTSYATLSHEVNSRVVIHTLSNGQSVSLPLHDDFYTQFVARNRGLISDDDQRRLRASSILVAGCGSVGGAVIEPLIRLGSERLVLAEPDVYDLHNINRQSVRLQDIGRNKAEVFQERMYDINPYATISVDTRGIIDDNVEALVRGADLVIDAVDVTSTLPLRSKFALHQAAKRLRVPVISGYDIAGLQLLRIYDYRRPATLALAGSVRSEEVDHLEPMQFLRRVIPVAAIPYEMIAELRRQLRHEQHGFPQIVYTANLFGVLALPAALDLLAGRRTRNRLIVDVPTLLRPRPTRLRFLLARLHGLYHLHKEFRR